MFLDCCCNHGFPIVTQHLLLPFTLLSLTTSCITFPQLTPVLSYVCSHPTLLNPSPLPPSQSSPLPSSPSLPLPSLPLPSLPLPSAPLPPHHSPPSCQVCFESPSKDLSTKLHNMSAMFGLYYKRDGRYNKGSEMWASGLCRYLHDAYPALTTQVLKLLTEVCMEYAKQEYVWTLYGSLVCAYVSVCNVYTTNSCNTKL